MYTSLKKLLIEEVIAELGQFSVHSKKKAVYLRFIFNCCASHPIHTKISGEYDIKTRVFTHLKISVIKRQSAFCP